MVNIKNRGIDERDEAQELFKNLRTSLPELEKLLTEVNNEWVHEDGFYRFYHQSFKVFYLQNKTDKIVKALSDLMPDRKLNEWFQQIVTEGTGKQFELSHNARWLQETRPMVEAFSHAKFFLEMAVKYGKTLDNPPDLLPSGWALFLYLYDLR